MNKSIFNSHVVLSLILLQLTSLNLAAQRSNHGNGGRGGDLKNYAGGGSSSGNYRGADLSSMRNNSNRSDNNFRTGNAINSVRPVLGGGAGGRTLNSATFSSRNNYANSRTNISINIGNNMGYGGYNSYYRSNFSYNYYPRYNYSPIYYSPYTYIHYGPLFGYRLSVLPFGYYPFYLGYDPYYYYNGIYYRPYANGGYEVTPPPLGATVKHLPDGNKETTINGQQYYELGGTFYQAVYNSKNKLQYVVVGTNGVINQVDATQPIAPAKSQQNIIPLPDQQLQPQQMITNNLNQLPVNTKVVTIQQKKYYVAPSGVYYQEIIGTDNIIFYQPVGGLNAEDSL